MSTQSSRPSRLQLGLTVPVLLLLALLADVASRFVSYDHVSFRAWEALHRYGGLGFGGPFEPNRKYVNDRAYGDLSSLGNYPALRQYRREEFTTDAFGFRNPSRAGDPPCAAVLLGTSFAAGSSLSDDETLSARLEQLLGRGVYNAAGLDAADGPQLTALLDRLGMRSGTVIEEHVESAPAPHPGLVRAARSGAWRDRVQGHLDPRHYRDLEVARAAVRGWIDESPLKLTLFRGFKGLEDDVVLPNTFRSAVVPSTLANGDPMLFQAKQIASAQRRTPVAQAVTYWEALASRLRARGLNLLVVLVPTQYQVYGPLIAGGAPNAGAEGVAYLAELERGLHQRDVPVVNLTETFLAAARDGLAGHRYIYWRDDTHWTAAGVALAAAQVTFTLQRLPDLADH